MSSGYRRLEDIARYADARRKAACRSDLVIIPSSSTARKNSAADSL
jgi:hypothetical protein